jgi:hypothetical protein
MDGVPLWLLIPFGIIAWLAGFAFLGWALSDVIPGSSPRLVKKPPEEKKDPS